MLRKVFFYLTHWEVWHWFAKYIILGPAWVWICIRSKSTWFFTPSNPSITFGGFLGETKRESYKLLPPGSYPKSIFISPADSYEEIKNRVISNGFQVPFVVKPDIGMMGFMFRKIESFDQLRQYHAVMTSSYIVQELADYPVEVSVFYYRYPGERKGHITGFVKKECMTVIGDGRSTLKELILAYPRARFRTKELFGKHANQLNEIIEDGKPFILSDALNLSRGGRLVSLEHEKDDRLLAVFDGLSNHSGSLFYGRYDIKCESIDDLKQGKNFTILEYNGCGGEPHHVYGNGNSFFKACGILIDHWKILYEISLRNRERGIEVWDFQKGLKFLRSSKEHFRKLKELDHVFSFKTERHPVVENPAEEYFSFIDNKAFPCVAAKAAYARDQVRVMVCEHIACPKDDYSITKFLYEFVDDYRQSSQLYNSAVIIFKGPSECSEEQFDMLMWQRLQAISDFDAEKYPWDKRVSNDPQHAAFSFSVKEEAFYIIGLHPGSSRKSRRFKYPALVFNPHDQFEKLRTINKYSSMKDTVRKRDQVYSGSINPMLADFGESSEAFQYSGRVYNKEWKCPFVSNHENDTTKVTGDPTP